MPSLSPHYVLLGPAWSRAFRCLWMLEEVGAKYELIADAKPSSRATLLHNPAGKVPVLLEYLADDVKKSGSSSNNSSNREPSSSTDDPNSRSGNTPSFVLTESTAINTYLGQGTQLVPSDKHQRAHYDAMLSYLMSEVDAPLWLLAKHTGRLSSHFGKTPEIVKPCHKELIRAHASLLPGLNPYVLGSQFTAADILYCHCLEWQKSIGDDALTLDDRLVDYLKVCRERPAYQRAQAHRQSSSSSASSKPSGVDSTPRANL